MAVRVNEVNQVTQVPDAQKTQAGDGSFKFTLASAITDADLQAKVDALMQDSTGQQNSRAYGYQGYEAISRAHKGFFK